jgi:glyoxylase I family protein
LIKGIRGIHHVGLSVPSIASARAFYCDVLGMEATSPYDFSPSARGDAILELKGASARSILLRAGNTYLELFEFTQPRPEPRDSPPRVCDHGFTHLAFEIESEAIEGLYTELEEAGVRWHAPLSTDEDGFTNTYGRDPFGNIIEIQAVDAESEFGVGQLPRWNP